MKIKHLSVISLIIIAIIAGQGCSIIPKTTKAGVQLTAEAAQTIQDGKTTKEDVILALGEPTKTLEAGKIWIYQGSKSTAVAGFNFGGQKRLTLVFAEDGRVVKHSYKEE